MSKTRELIEKSGTFAIQIPNAAQLQLTYDVGNNSLFNDPIKLDKCGVKLFDIADYNLPFVEGIPLGLHVKLFLKQIINNKS